MHATLKLALALGLLWSDLVSASPVLVEVKADLQSTWYSNSSTNLNGKQSKFSTRCIFNTNSWFIHGDFLMNASESHWLLGTNVLVERVITTNRSELRQRFAAEALRPRPGEKFTETHPAFGGFPPGTGIQRVPWLAFCSGPYLRHEGRHMPRPIGRPGPFSRYTDETEVFGDALGLPQHMRLYSPEHKMICEYRVLRSTNFFGWNIPVEIQLTSYAQTDRGKADLTSRTELTGMVESLGMAEEPKPPSWTKLE